MRNVIQTICKWNLIGYLFIVVSTNRSLIPEATATTTTAVTPKPPSITPPIVPKSPSYPSTDTHNSFQTSTYLRNTESSNESNVDPYDQQLLKFLNQYNSNQKQPKKNTSTTTTTNSDISTFNNNQCTTRTQFVNLCNLHHSSSFIRNDDFISNEETASFFLFLCKSIQNPSCDDDDSISYYNLSVSLQLRFLKVVCPRGEDGIADQDCIDELYAGGNEFGVEITDDNESVVNRNMELYCEDIYDISTEFHFGSCEDEPSQRPSPEPSQQPSGRPIDGNIDRFTTAPPSAIPTYDGVGGIRPSREFTYMMAFNDVNVLRGVIGNGRFDILDASSNAIDRILISRSDLIRERRGDGGPDDDLDGEPFLRIPRKGVEHIYIEEHQCLDEVINLAQSTRELYCIVFVSKVRLELYGDELIPGGDVNDAVFTPMRKSMNDERWFIILVNRLAMNDEDVKVVYYIADGFKPPRVDDPTNSLPRWALALIITFCLLLLICFVVCCIRCCRRRNDDSEHDSDSRGGNLGKYYGRDVIEERDFSSDDELELYDEHFEDNDIDFITSYQKKMNRDLSAPREKMYKADTSSSSSSPSLSTTQKISNTMSAEPSSTSFNFFDAEEKDNEVKNENESLKSYEAKDWRSRFSSTLLFGGGRKKDNDDNADDEEAKIENDTKTKNEESNNNKNNNNDDDNISSMTPSITNISVASSSADSDLSPNTLLKSITNEEKIDEAIDNGDWNAVASFANEGINEHDDLSAFSSIRTSQRSGVSYDPSTT